MVIFLKYTNKERVIFLVYTNNEKVKILCFTHKENTVFLVTNVHFNKKRDFIGFK